MINKLKITFLVAVLSLLGASFAYAANLNYSSATNISVGGYTYVISAGSAATTVAVSANTIAVEVPTGSTFTLTSAAGAQFNNNGSLTTSCSGGSSSLIVPGNTGTVVTITPYTGSTCSVGGGGALYAGSGSTATTTTTTTTTTTGGTSSTTTPTTTPVNVSVTPVSSTPMAQTDPGCSGGNKYSTSTGNLCVNTLVAASKTYNFGTAVLKKGSKGDAVKELQRFLNDTLNLGLVLDGKLGAKTIAVIKQWQKNHGLVADGMVGAKTKAKMSASVQ